MLRVAFALYRQWGFDIFKEVFALQNKCRDFKIVALLAAKSYQFDITESYKTQLPVYVIDPSANQKIYQLLKLHRADIVFFYSWSWLVKPPIIDDFVCLCLHPSPLPQGRGGSPIQNQILKGVKKSALTLFRMDQGTDTGPVYQTIPMSLTGDINDIFKRMANLGTKMTKNLIADHAVGKLNFIPQKNPDKFPTFKRRIPAESEIELKKLKQTRFEKLYDMVRSLTGPYPNCFIRFDRQILRLQQVQFSTKAINSALIIDENVHLLPKNKNVVLYLKLADGFARIIKYDIQILK